MKLLLTSLIVSLASYVTASPVTILVSYSPPITSPDANTVWTIGATETVTWDASNPPSQITNPNGFIYLRRNDMTDLDNPLAGPFNITEGSQTVTVPNVPPGDDYVLVLMGNSGNWSPPFTIQPAPEPEPEPEP